MQMQAVLGQPSCMQQMVCKRSGAMKCLQANSVSSVVQVPHRLRPHCCRRSTASLSRSPPPSPPVARLRCRPRFVERWNTSVQTLRTAVRRPLRWPLRLGRGPLGTGGLQWRDVLSGWMAR